MYNIRSMFCECGSSYYKKINFICKRPTCINFALECVEFELPVWTGSNDCTQLMVIICVSDLPFLEEYANIPDLKTCCNETS